MSSSVVRTWTLSWLLITATLGLAIITNISPGTQMPLEGQIGGSSSSTGNPLLDAQTLNSSHFTYLGKFTVPDSVPGLADYPTSSFSNGGIAIRRVGGQLRFFFTAHAYGGGKVFETNYPGQNIGGGVTATVVRAWGDIYNGKKCEFYQGNWTCGLSSGFETHGLYWDEQDQRLYWNAGDWYDTQNYDGKPAFGYATLNDNNGTSQGFGPWGLANTNAHWTRGCTMGIPQWFADQFTGGKRLGIGCGGMGFSINAVGSKGVTVAAINPPSPTTATGSPLPNVRLVGYPNAAPYSMDREHRSANYLQNNDGWAAQGSTGYPTWMDGTGQLCTIVSTTNYQGLLCGRARTEGRETYHWSTIINEKYGFWWSVYDLKDLGAVANGTKNMWQIQPKYQWRDAVLSSNNATNQGRYTGGIAYDEVTQRVFVQRLGDVKIGCCGYPGSVYVFQLNIPTDSVFIKQHPMPSQVFVGQTASFSVEAGGTGLNYQWQVSTNNGTSWSAIPGATGTSYSVITTGGHANNLYRVQVTKDSMTKTSDAALLMVLQPGAPAIQTHPQNITVAPGSNATFSVLPVGAKENYFYTWERSSDGGVTWQHMHANGSTFWDTVTMENVTLADNGKKIRVTVIQNYANGTQSVLSNVATLTVSGAGGSSSSSSSSSSSLASSSSSSLSSSSSSFSSSSSLASSSSSANSSSSSSGGGGLNAAVLNQNHMTYLGNFRAPDSIPVGNQQTSSYSIGGLAFRWLNGQLRFFLTSHAYDGGLVYEINYPGHSTTNPPVATFLKNWGDVYDGNKCEFYQGVWTCSLGSGQWTHGLYFDDETDRLYWSYGDWYDTQNYAGKPAFGFATINDTTGVAQGYGPWGVAGINAHWTRGGITPIPQWFADQFTGGKKLGIGFGGMRYSIIGAASKGTALMAVDAPTPTTATGTGLPKTMLVGYPDSGGTREYRAANYFQMNDTWAANGTIGYPTWLDSAGQACTMVSTNDFQGLLCARNRPEGRETYRQSTIVNENPHLWWVAYDLKDLGDVANGTKQMWQIQPRHQWRETNLDTTFPEQIGGITFDPSTNRVYVEKLQSVKIGCCSYPPSIYIYQLSIPTSTPLITQSPMPSNVIVGQTANFAVEAQGTGLSYQWQRSNDNGSSWSNITGAVSQNYSLTTVLSDANAQFRVIVTSGTSSKTSAPTTLWVIPPGPPQIATQPQSQNATAGGTVTFSVVTVGAINNYFYTWEKSTNNGTTWSNYYGNGSTFEDTLTINPVTIEHHCLRIRVRVLQRDSQGLTEKLSNVATLTVNGGSCEGFSSSSSSSSSALSSSSSSSAFSSSSSTSSFISSSNSSSSSSSAGGPAPTPPPPPPSPGSSASSSSSATTLLMSAPQNGATVSATIPVSAVASRPVAQVQFMLDGSKLGSPDTTAPYSITWDTTTVASGDHTLGATALLSSGAGSISAPPIVVHVSNHSAPNQAPDVNAGTDKTITLPDSATLNGSATDDGLPNDVLTLLWSKVSGPGTVSFVPNNAEVSAASFSTAGTYVLRLTASDGELSASDEVTIIVKPVPVTNQPPVVNAGENQNITLPSSALLRGTATDDGLPNPPSTLTLLWSKVSGPGAVSFETPTELSTVTSFSTAGTYVLRLSASDSALSDTDDVTVVVAPEPPKNQAPTVNAGYDQNVELPAKAILEGSASDDGLPVGSTLSPKWIAGPNNPGTVTFGNANAFGTTASFSEPGMYTLILTVSDGSLLGSDSMVVMVKPQPPQNQPPFIYAGSDQNIQLPTEALLSGKYDDDGLPKPPGTVSGRWSKVSGPGTVTFSNTNSFTTSAAFSLAGTYTLRLTGTDGELSASDDMIVVVADAPKNTAPVVKAGQDQTITLPNLASLVGIVTDDGLPNPPGITTMVWSKASGPGTVTFSTPEAEKTTATFSTAGTYVLRLTAKDGGGLTGMDTVTVVVKAMPNNKPPVARAGQDRTVMLPAGATARILMTGKVSDDGLPNPPGAVTVQWTQVEGPKVQLSDPFALQTYVEFKETGLYVFRLTANDGSLEHSDTIVITVKPYNAPPKVDAGMDQTVKFAVGFTSLRGVASDDGYPNPPGSLSTIWSQVTGPSMASFDDNGRLDPIVKFRTPGIYVLRLRANDGAKWSQPDDVIITVVRDSASSGRQTNSFWGMLAW